MGRTPVISKRGVEVAGSEKVGQFKARALPLVGKVEPAGEIVIAPEDALEVGGKAELLKFMEDVLSVTVMSSGDKDAMPVVTVWNSGRPFHFIRGYTHEVKRKFVEVLARAKHTSIRVEISKDILGEPTNKVMSQTGVKYPFTVHSDPAGAKGREWLEHVLQEA